MSFKHLFFSAACVLLLTACGNDSTSTTDQSGSIEDGEKKSTEITQQDTEQKQVVEEKDKALNTDKDNTEKESAEKKATEDSTISKEPQKEETSVAMNATEAPEEDVDQIAEGEGFSVVDGEVEAAKNIPKADEEAILAAFEEYIAAFNAKDITRYKNVLAQSPEGFDLQEDLDNSQQIFDNFDINRQVDNVTITEYSGDRAYVYADVVVEVKQDNNKARDEGKQLTQFVKESSGWKVTSLQAIGSAAN
ncbi:MAG: nuclear transport factor 2 family protein [Kurthia sp.]|nr:nuclear transport factor 2 family protein [Candidatus Kurthia equi]